MKVLITEDHASTRLGMREILKHEFPALDAGFAADAGQTYARLAEQPWDLLILDLTLPGPSGTEVLAEVRQRWPKLPVLIYSAHPAREFAVHMLRAGAAGYLTKERAPEELCRAVRRILDHGTYLGEGTAGHVAHALKADRAAGSHELLSAREFQVLRLLAAGRSGKETAAALKVSQKTVSTYRARILGKLQLGSTAELVRYAVQARLV